MPIEKESEKIDKSSDIESLSQSLNSFYIDIIRNAQTAQQKFPLKIAKTNVVVIICYVIWH